MKFKLTRRPGSASSARVTLLTIVPENADEETALGKCAIDIGAVSLLPPFKPKKANLRQAIERIKELVKGVR